MRFVLVAIALLFIAASASADTPPAGWAQIAPPIGGLEIDGDLLANTPVLGHGDWLDEIVTPSSGGAGTGVLNPDGSPRNSKITFHIIDNTASQGDDNFSGGNKKINADPNTWSWSGGQNTTAKDDLNNVLIHFAPDISTTSSKGHLWVMVAADRGAVNGTSYVDFEFLQEPLVKNDDGTFTSNGPDGGRTVNDFIITLDFTGGGSVAGYRFLRWELISTDSKGNKTFKYVDRTAGVVPGTVLAEVNKAVTPVPYGAFGTISYPINAFGEVAADLTALLGAFDACTSFGVKTVFVKTKTSDEDTATIVDFAAPQAVDVTIGPGAKAGPDQAHCDYSAADRIFTMAGEATPSIYGIKSTTWTILGGDPTVATITDPSSLVTTVTVNTSPITLRLTVLDNKDCPKTDDVVLTFSQPPSVAETHVDVNCFGASTGLIDITVTPTLTTGSYTFLWSPGGQTTEDISNLAEGSYTVKVTDPVTKCFTETTIRIAQPPLLVVTATPGAIACHGGDSSVTVSASGGTAPYTGTGTFTHKAGSYSYTVTDVNGCSATASGTITEPTLLTASALSTPILCHGGDSSVTVSASGGTAPYTGTGTFTHKAGSYSYTVTDVNGCSATASGTITEPTLLTASALPTPILCNGGDSSVTVSASGGTAPYTGTGTFTHKAGSYSYTVTDANGCSATASGTITEPTAVTLALDKTDANCDGNNGTVTATFGGGAPPYRAKIDAGEWVNPVNSPHTFINLAPGSHTVTVMDKNDCSIVDSKTVERTTIGVECKIANLAADDGPVCPGSGGHTYTAPANMTSWAWTISGNGTIDGDPAYIDKDGKPTYTSQSVTITAGSTCGSPFELRLAIVTQSGCELTCGKSVHVNDTEAPQIVGCPDTTLITCTGTSLDEFPNLTVSDNCAARLQWKRSDMIDNTAVGSDGWYESNDTRKNAPFSGSTTISIRAIDGCNRTDACTIYVAVATCDTYCTLTQGFYGNQKGKVMWPNAQNELVPTKGDIVVRNILAKGPIIIGDLSPTKGSLTIMPDAQACIAQLLPAGGSPRSISGIHTMTEGSCNPDPKLPVNEKQKDPRYSNVFLGQLITLSLNIRLDDRVSQSSGHLSGLSIATGQVCIKGKSPLVIDSTILDRMGTLAYSKTIGGLLAYANYVIGGNDADYLNKVADAVGKVNEAFDECELVYSECP